METEMSTSSDASDAKRSRYQNVRKVEQVEMDEDYELELHESGPVDFDSNDDGNENDWNDDDEDDDVQVEIRNQKSNLTMQKPLSPRKPRYYSKPRANTNAQERVTSEEQRSRLKRPFEEGQEANFELETDPVVVSRRSKQIQYGKSTPEYHNYLHAVPKRERKPIHPKTPNKHRKYSRRAWDGIIKQWRINLHVWSDYQIPAEDQLTANELDIEKLNESFTSEASGSTSTTSSVAAAFSAELGFLSSTPHKNICTKSRSTSESDSSISGHETKLFNSTVLEKMSRTDLIKKEEGELDKTLSTSWADEVEDYYDFKETSK